MERLNGYLNIGNFKQTKKAIEPSNYATAWYENKRIEYLFKIENKYVAYRELFYALIIRYLNLQSVNNDLAVRGKNFGIISENYNPNHKQVYSIKEILYAYWDAKIEEIERTGNYILEDDISYEHDYNLKRLPEIIKWFFASKNLEYTGRIEDEILTQFNIQILLGNRDLRDPNIEIIIDDVPKLAPFFDFSHYGTINIENKEHGYRFLYDKVAKNTKIAAKKTVEEYLKVGTRKELEQWKEYLEKIESMNLERIFLEIAETTSHQIEEEIKLQLKRNYCKNIESLRGMIKGSFRC